jgi:hypothetical protein
VTGAGFGGAQDLPQTALWAAVDAGGMVAWSLGGRFSLSLTLEGMVPTSRPPFVALEPPPSPPSIVLQRVSPVIGRSFLGVECRFF